MEQFRPRQGRGACRTTVPAVDRSTGRQSSERRVPAWSPRVTIRLRLPRVEKRILILFRTVVGRSTRPSFCCPPESTSFFASGRRHSLLFLLAQPLSARQDPKSKLPAPPQASSPSGVVFLTTSRVSARFSILDFHHQPASASHFPSKCASADST